MNKSKYIVYKHTSKTTRKAYIGLTRQGITVRFAEHCRDAKSAFKKNGKFHNAIEKYGSDDWIHEVLFVSFDYDYLNVAERLLITEYNTKNNGYNISPGGKYHNHHNMNRDYTSMKGLQNPAKRLAVRKKISKALTGNTHSSFDGYWKTPWGYFTSMSAIMTGCPYKISQNVIYKYCKNNQNFLTIGTVRQVPYFTKADVGKTFRDLGFGYITASRGQSLESALLASGL